MVIQGDDIAILIASQGGGTRCCCNGNVVWRWCLGGGEESNICPCQWRGGAYRDTMLGPAHTNIDHIATAIHALLVPGGQFGLWTSTALS
eukprot:scaffold156792_cov69-Attheya_sp.AAC.1